MNIQSTVREIGAFETARNLANVLESNSVAAKVGAEMPLPETSIEDRIHGVAEWLLAFNKSKYMFLNAEFLLIETMADLAKSPFEALIVVSRDMTDDSKSRLISNLPHRDNLIVTVLEEPYFANIYPSSGMLVFSGYEADGRMMALTDTYRMIEEYSSFYGRKAFIPYVSLDSAVRYRGWMEVRYDRITDVWREVR